MTAISAMADAASLFASGRTSNSAGGRPLPLGAARWMTSPLVSPHAGTVRRRSQPITLNRALGQALDPAVIAWIQCHNRGDRARAAQRRLQVAQEAAKRRILLRPWLR